MRDLAQRVRFAVGDLRNRELQVFIVDLELLPQKIDGHLLRLDHELLADPRIAVNNLQLLVQHDQAIIHVVIHLLAGRLVQQLYELVVV